MHVLKASNRLAGERHNDVADDQAGFVGRAFGFHLENDGRSSLFAVQGLAQGFGQAHGLEADAEVSARDAAFLQERVDHGVDRGGRDGDRAETCETWRGDAEDAAVRVNRGGSRGGRR